MRLSDLKIAARLGALGLFFLVALLVVAYAGYHALSSTNTMGANAMQQTATLTDAIDTARSAQVEFKIQVQEWKNILLRGHDPEQLSKYTASFKKSSATTTAELQRVNTLLGKLGVKTPLVDDAIKAHDELGKNYLTALEKYDSANPDSHKIVDDLVKGMDRAPTEKINDIVAFVQKQAKTVAANMDAERAAAEKSTIMMILATLVVTIVVGGAITVWLVRSITGPLDEAVSVAETVANGDLTMHISADGGDEVATLLRALKRMHDSLADIVARVRVGTDSIAVASTEIAQGNLDLSSRTEEQASSLEETASSMEELTTTVRQNSENANTASDLAGTASNVAVRGGEAVAQVVQTMDAINESSRKIVDIIAVIDGIAFQTNILALNAAVEAARAGEQGRGFAVVASEVRNLAQRSASAAKEIKELIGNSVEKVEAGTRLVGQAGTTMNEVVSSVKRVTDIIGEIAMASGEQNAGIDQINVAITNMDAVTQQNAALVEEAAAAADAMQHQAASLKDAVSVFRVSDAAIAAASASAGKPARTSARAAAPVKRPQLRAPAPAPVARPTRKAAAKEPEATAEADWEEF